MALKRLLRKQGLEKGIEVSKIGYKEREIKIPTKERRRKIVNEEGVENIEETTKEVVKTKTKRGRKKKV
jgi:hypothetical protein